jgi:hypothetical protein
MSLSSSCLIALKLLVEHAPVADDDHRVEHLGSVAGTQGCQLMRGPRDRVRLSRTGGVLDQEPGSRAGQGDVGDDVGDCFPLVVAREQRHRWASTLRSVHVQLGRLRLDVYEAAEDVEPDGLVEDPFPEVGGGVSTRVR